MDNLVVTIIQSDIHWQSIDANLAMFEEKLWAASPKSDLIILPEMFNTGFTMEVHRFAEPMNGKTFRWMRQISEQFQTTVTGSYMVAEKNAVYNRLIWMDPDGKFNFYDKRHLFRMAGENNYFTPGNRLIAPEIKGWKIRPLICYDLRFPVWIRNKMNHDKTIFSYDLLLFVANWPAPRIKSWDALLKARAIENSSYCLGVNRIGEDGEGISYNGHSCIYNCKGEELFPLSEGEFISSNTLYYEELMRFRQKFPIHIDGDDYDILT